LNHHFAIFSILQTIFIFALFNFIVFASKIKLWTARTLPHNKTTNKKSTPHSDITPDQRHRNNNNNTQQEPPNNIVGAIPINKCTTLASVYSV